MFRWRGANRIYWVIVFDECVPIGLWFVVPDDCERTYRFLTDLFHWNSMYIEIMILQGTDKHTKPPYSSANHSWMQSGLEYLQSQFHLEFHADSCPFASEWYYTSWDPWFGVDRWTGRSVVQARPTFTKDLFNCQLHWPNTWFKYSILNTVSISKPQLNVESVNHSFTGRTQT